MTAPTKNRIRIEPDFEALLPTQTAEELAQLEANIVEEGRCLLPAVVWKETGILLDGHTRVRICRRKRLPRPKTIRLSFDSPEAAKRWMLKHALGRRNLSAEQQSLIRGNDYLIAVHAVGENQYTMANSEGKSKAGKNPEQNSKKPRKNRVGQIDQPTFTGKKHDSTAAQVAEQHNVSEKTIRRDAEFATAVRVITEATNSQILGQILAIKHTQPEIIRLGALGKMQIRQAAKLITSGKVENMRAVLAVVEVEREPGDDGDEAENNDKYFAERKAIYRGWVNTLNELAKAVEAEASERIAGGHLKELWPRLKEEIAAAKGTISGLSPAQVCHKCEGDGCRSCKNTGFLTRTVVQGLPKEERG